MNLPNIGEWLADFYTGDMVTRGRAVIGLSVAPLTMVLPYLLAMLHDPDKTLVAAACDIVAAQGLQEAVPTLEQLAAARYRGYDYVDFNAAVAEALTALQTQSTAQKVEGDFLTRALMQARRGTQIDPTLFIAAYPVAAPAQQTALLQGIAGLPATPETQALAQKALSASDPLMRLTAIYAVGQLCPAEAGALWTALRETLQQSIDQGGSAWEQNLYGEKGQWDQRSMRILHLEGQPCPVCGTTVENIKTGGTHTRVCPVCQPI